MRVYLTPLERTFRLIASSSEMPTRERIRAIERMSNPSETYLLRLLKAGKGRKVRGKRLRSLPMKLRMAVAVKLDELQQQLQRRKNFEKQKQEKVNAY
jgi:hypothetical protein